jgi:hypothetical protein
LKYSIQISILILFILALVPLIILAFCNHPLGLHEWDWITNLKGYTNDMTFWEEQKYYYENVMGRYSSTFISSLSDNLYSPLSFKLFFIFNILLSFFAISIGVKTLFYNLIGKEVFIISIILWITWISGISGIYDTLFMLTSVHTYLYGFYGLIFLVYFWDKLLKNYKTNTYHVTFWKGVILISTIFTIGTNEISLFYVLITNCFITIYNHKKKELHKFIIFVLLISLFFTLFSLLTPANFERNFHYGFNYSQLELLFISVSTSIFNVFSWIVNGQLIWGSLLFIFLIEPIKIYKNKLISFKYLIALATLSVLVGHFLIIFGTNGASIAERVIDLIFLHFIFFWYYGLFIFINNLKVEDYQIFRYPIIKRIFRIIVFYYMFVLFANGLSINRENKNFSSFLTLIEVKSNLGEAWLTVLSGSAFNYNQSMQLQYEQLKNCKADTCFVEKPEIAPKILYHQLSDRRNRREGDTFLGFYFNSEIKSVKYGNK